MGLRAQLKCLRRDDRDNSGHTRWLLFSLVDVIEIKNVAEKRTVIFISILRS